jgi:hypothetical protein
VFVQFKGLLHQSENVNFVITPFLHKNRLQDIDLIFYERLLKSAASPLKITAILFNQIHQTVANKIKYLILLTFLPLNNFPKLTK